MQTGTYYLCNISRRAAKLNEGALVEVRVKESIFSVLRLLHFYHKPLKKQFPAQVLALLRSSGQLLTAIAQRCHCRFSLAGDAGKKIKVGLKWGLRWV